MRAWNAWTTKELKTLRSLAGTMDIHTLASHFNHSISSIRLTASRYKICVRFDYDAQINEKNVECILTMISNTSISNVARIMQMSEKQLMKQVNKATS